MKTCIILLAIALCTGVASAQIKDVTQNGTSFLIKKENGNTSSIGGCRDCSLAGFTNQYVVIVWPPEYCTSSSAGCKEVVIYNANGDRYGSFIICKECSVKSVLTNKIIHTNDPKSSSTSAHDFKGNRVSN